MEKRRPSSVEHAVTQSQNLIDRSLQGDGTAHEELLFHACDRLLRRWEQTDDIFQNSMVKLHLALSEVRVESVRHIFNLAAAQVRWELLDLTRHHFGPHGDAAKHHTDGQPADNTGGSLHAIGSEPQDLESWSELNKTRQKTVMATSHEKPKR